MANTSIRTLNIIAGANVSSANDRFIVHDYSANVDFAITGSGLKAFIGNVAADPMTFAGSSSEVFISTAGDVGLGTTTPETKLHIDSGAIKITNAPYSALYIDCVGGSNDAAQIDLVGGSNKSSTIQRDLNNTTILHFGNTAPGTTYVLDYAEDTSNSVNSSLSFGVDRSTRMTVKGNGNVGIGTQTPVNTLHVSVATGANNSVSYPLRVETQTTTSPAVGIGTGIEFVTETANDNIEVGARIESVATDVTSTTENFDLVFKTMSSGTAATERLRISSAGTTILAGDLAVNGGDITTSSTTLNVATTNATTVNAWSAATTINSGYIGTANSTINISTGATTSGSVKTVNVGTDGLSGSTTNINLGSSNGGTVSVLGALDVSATADTVTAATHYYVETATDGKVRPKTLANVKSEIVTTAAVNSAAATTVGTITTGVWNAGAVTSSGAVSAGTSVSATTSVTAGTYTTTGIAAAYTNIATSANIDFTAKAVAKVTPTAAVTVTATVPPAGTTTSLIVLTSGATSYTITFSTGFKTATTTLATGTVTAKYFVINYLSDGTQLIETSRTAAI